VRDCEADPVAAEDLRESLVVRGWKASRVTVQEGLSGGMKLGTWRMSVTAREHSPGLNAARVYTC